MNKWIKRYLVLLLILIMLIQNIFTVYAIDYNATGLNNTSTNATSNIGNGTWNIPLNTGFRFTITDRNGNVVSNILGQGYGSLDVVNDGVKRDVGLCMGGCATDASVPIKAWLGYSEFIGILNAGATPLPQWVDSAEVLYGQPVREWILKGNTIKSDLLEATGNVVGSIGSVLSDGVNYVKPNTGNTGSTNKNTGSSNKNENTNKEAETIAIQNKNYENVKREINNIPKVTATTTPQEYMKKSQAYVNKIDALLAVSYVSPAQATQLAKLAAEKKAEIVSTQMRLQLNKGLNVGDNHKHNIFDLFTITSYASTTVIEAGNNEEEHDTDFDRLQGKKYVAPDDEWDSYEDSGPGVELDKNGNKGNTHITDNEDSDEDKGSDEDKESNEDDGAYDYDANDTGYAWSIINMTLDNQYVFQLPGSASVESATDKSKRIRPGDIFIENDYRLVVENTIQGIPQKSKKAGGANYPSYVYGTAHNWAVFGSSVWMPWYGGGMGDTFGNHQRYLTRMLPRALMTDKVWTDENGEVVLNPTPDLEQWSIGTMMNLYNTGFGTQVYKAGDLIPGIPIPDTPINDYNIIHTYNILTEPEYDDYSEPSDEKKDPEEFGDKSLHFSIDKHYRYRDSITNEVTEISYYTTVNAPHTVVIQDEREQTGFALKDWFTSTDDWLPPEGGTPSDYNWESVVKGQHKDGKYAGTGETTLRVKPEDPDNVLHLLYEFEGKPFINIVKIYKNEDGSVNHTKGPEPHEDTKKYKVEEDEEGFTYVETLISAGDPDPGNPNGTPTKSRDIDIPKGTKTLYIIYQAKGKQIILYSNELTYTYDLRDLVKERVLFGIYDKAPASPATEPECEQHSCGGSGKNCPHYHTCTLYSQWLPDSSFSMTVADNFDYNNGTTFILDYVQTNKGGASFSKSWTTGVSGKTPGISDRVKPNYDYVLYRQKDKDLVTLYPKKNDGLSGELSRLGINTTAYTPAGSRAEKEMTKDKYFENHLQTHFDYTAHDTNLTWNWSRAECNTNNTGNYNTQAVATPQGANDFYSKNPSNVKEYYFVGQSNEGLDTNISDTRPGDDSFVSRYKRNQAYATVSAELSFYPYAKMFYRAKDANDNLQDVFVTSENLSKMSVFNAMQVGIYKKNEINANLTSTQWSTHARSLTFLEKTGVSDKKSVLPGGAIQDIDMSNQGDTQLGLRLWQTCLPDGQVEAVQEGFKVSETEARSATDALMESIKTAIGGYGLVQWGTEGVQTDFRSVLSGTELHENTSVPFVLGNSGTTAADDKYYLRHDGSGSSRANFDCLDARIERQNLYTIYSDTDGNVWVTKDGAELGRISITESAETLINKSKELQLLDANTKLITNYVSALDRNKGDKSKYDRYDKNKYNEAFDGVSVLLTDMSFDIGFGQGMAKRTNVLDPLLVAQAESKSDLYNFDDANKVRSSVYVTTTTSTAAEKQQEGYFGTLKAVSGIGDLEIGISDIQSMVYTKNFYIPNATVSDLN